MMGDPLESSRLSSQKQNHEGVAEAQSGQYCATAEFEPGMWWELGAGCDNLVSGANPWPEVCRLGRWASKGGGL